MLLSGAGTHADQILPVITVGFGLEEFGTAAALPEERLHIR